MKLLRDECGVNSIRLRVWVNPTEGWNDIDNMVRHYRNSPSVVMWSIGNEVPSQWGPVGMDELVMLRDKVRRLDTTRPITCGMDQIDAVLGNGFAAALDIPGFNYKPQRYDEAYAKLPQRLILGSETASTVSSRGVYHFPVTYGDHNSQLHPDNQSSSYDTEACYWSNTPDIDFARDDVLPHWNWKGREGQVTPVFVYTSYPKAELFVNGVSHGIREKDPSSLYDRYRLRWNDVVYEPGELKVVAYDAAGNVAAERTVVTAGKPHHLVVSANREQLAADGADLVYFTVRVADRNGNIVPTDSRKVSFEVSGAGSFEATANGDPTCLMPFQNPEMKLFSGAATAIARSATQAGTLRFTVKAKGVKPATVEITVR